MRMTDCAATARFAPGASGTSTQAHPVILQAGQHAKLVVAGISAEPARVRPTGRLFLCGPPGIAQTSAQAIPLVQMSSPQLEQRLRGETFGCAMHDWDSR